MFRRFLLHKAIGDKGLLLILPKPPLCPRLLLGTFVGNVNLHRDFTLVAVLRQAGIISAANPNTVELTVRSWQAVGYFALSPCGRGMVQILGFSGNSTDRPHASTVEVLSVVGPMAGSGTLVAVKAQYV